MGDVGLRFLTYETTVDIANKFGFPSCQFLTLGTVAWSTQQKTRTDLYVVKAEDEVCNNYQICCNWLSDHTAAKDTGFVATYFARELIAENLAKSLPWYSGILDKVNSNDLFKQLSYERKGLCQIIQKIKWSSKYERLFVQACHEAIKFTYGQISEQAKNVVRFLILIGKL